MIKHIIITMIFIYTLMMTSCGFDEEINSDMYRVGIIQYAENDTLNSSTSGFISVLEREGYIQDENCIIEIQYGQADISEIESAIDDFVKTKVDLIVTVGDHVAEIALEATIGIDIPIIYMGETDPIDNGLVLEDGTPTGNITGVSIQLDKEEQIRVIRQMLPSATRLGVIYGNDDISLGISIAEYETIMHKYDFNLIGKSINNSASVEVAVEQLVEEVDCIISFQDNMVSHELPRLISIANDNNIPVFSFEIDQVKYGCIAAEGIDYYTVGREAGVIAAQVLSEDISILDVPYIVVNESQLCINESVIEQLGIVLSDVTLEEVTVTFESVVDVY